MREGYYVAWGDGKLSYVCKPNSLNKHRILKNAKYLRSAAAGLSTADTPQYLIKVTAKVKDPRYGG